MSISKILSFLDRAERKSVERFVDNIVTDYVARGEGTGSLSKILSGFTFLILTILAVQLFKDEQYIPLIVLSLLAWTRFGFLVLAGAFVYFLVAKYWSGVIILISYFVISGFSVYCGKINVKKLLLSDKPIISPFENMPDLLPILVLECLFLALTLFFSGILSYVFGILFILMFLFHMGRYWIRLRPRYNQIHLPLMIRYARSAARETVESRNEGRDFDFVRAMQLLLESVFPNNPERVEKLVNRALDKMNSFADRQLIEATIKRKNPNADPSQVKHVLDQIYDLLRTQEGKKFIIQYGIAEIVESIFGLEERGRYLLAVFAGEVR